MRAVPIKYFDDGEYMACYNALKVVQANGRRVRVWYGSHQTGNVYPQEYDIMGYISQSTGREPCFLLVNNKRSYGGTALYPDNVVGIQYIDTRDFIYKHSKFNKPEYGVEPLYNDDGIFRCFRVTEKSSNGVVTSYALGLGTYAKAQHLADFMNGLRMVR